MSAILFETHLKDNNYEQVRFAKFKSELLAWGEEYIQEFLGITASISAINYYDLDKMMNETYAQMSEEELEEFYSKFEIDKILEEEENDELLAEIGPK